MHKVGQDPDHSTCMYGYNARHNNTGVLPTVVHLSYHAPRGRCVRLYAQRRCGARDDTGGAARARACEPFRHNTGLSTCSKLCARQPRLDLSPMLFRARIPENIESCLKFLTDSSSLSASRALPSPRLPPPLASSSSRLRCATNAKLCHR